MKLAAWAQQVGIHEDTAYKYFHAGCLPVPAVQLPTGTILVQEPTPALPGAGTALYARVSSPDQRADLDRQLGHLVAWAAEGGLAVTLTVPEAGSGLNGRRPKLARLLPGPGVGTIVVEHRDRLARFGVEHLESALSAKGRHIIVVDGDELADEPVRDMTEVLTSMCARPYGRRSAARRARAAVAAAGAGGTSLEGG